MTPAAALGVEISPDTRPLEEVAAIIAKHLNALVDELADRRARQEEQE